MRNSIYGLIGRLSPGNLLLFGVILVTVVLLLATCPALADEAPLPAGVDKRVVDVNEKFKVFSGIIEETDVRLDENGKAITDSGKYAVTGYITVEIKTVKGQKLIDPGAYRFNGDTLVYGKKGEEIDMETLPVPCKARVYYYRTGGEPVLYRIDLLSFGNGSSSKWNDLPKM